MKQIAAITFLCVLAITICYTNLFQGFFLPDKYYQNIFEGPFNASEKGASIKIKLEQNYDAEHSLYLTVPDYKSVELRSEKGVLHYKFISDGKILKEGMTGCPSGAMGYRSQHENFRSAILLDFILPYPKARSNLILELRADNPMTLLQKYAGKIRLGVAPTSLK